MTKCEFCQKPIKKIFKDFSFCRNCQVIFNISHEFTKYEDSYFEEEYKKQYGRTYIEDKSNLQKRMFGRLNLFLNITNCKPGLTLLEIGSAAGFFIEASREKGFQAEGREVSSYMSEYANKHGYATVNVSFLDMINKKQDKKFDVVCAFYVIEHFSFQKKVWEGLSSLVRNHGYLMLALPSLSGPLYWFHKKKWINSHPQDHYIDFTHQGIKKVSKMFGFKTLHIGAEGIHPDRFPLGKIWGLRSIFSLFQRKYGYSDTIFVILQKT